MRKTLSYNDYLTGKGLFHLAQEHYRKAREFEGALCDLLKCDDGYADCVSDEMCEESGTFEAGLEKHKVRIQPPQT